jgi:acyl-coenzyme A thioesterase PaaI-like protein
MNMAAIMTDKVKAFQDYYPDNFSQCYGCGRLNDKGLQIKSRWDGDETVCIFNPDEKYMAIPGMVYGGLIASIIDCHSTGSAAAFAAKAEGREIDSDPAIRFLTAALHVDFKNPTPMGVPLELRSQAKEIKPKKVVITTVLTANGIECARGEVVAVRVSDAVIKAFDKNMEVVQ